jgi:hypothetical protein
MAQSSPQPNPQLEAALVQFGQSGATPVQEAQLRAALAADAKLMRDYNQAAQAGQVQSFALPAAGSGPNIVGHYDIAGGVVTLPASAFQPSGNTPSADLRGSLQVQEMMARFGHSSYQLPGATPGAAATTHPMTQHMLDNFQNTVNQSPVAAADMMRAATTRDPNATPRAMLLENFGFVGPGMSAGGTYNPSTNTLNLPPLNLQTPTPGGPGRFSADDMTFVIGHEVDHSFNSVAKAQALSTFSQSVRQIAGSAAVVHDYTAPATNYIEAARRDEASAEIAGWNALVSRQQQLNPNTSLSTIVALTTTSRQADFISLDPATGSVAIRPGLTFNPDATLPDTPANVAAMGQHYFNRPDPANAQPGQRPVTLGESGRSDYPNYYGTFVVEEIIQAERQHAAQHPGVTHKLTLNMSAIGLRETLMEQEGINIRTNPATPQTYYDSSQTPPVQGTFHHTQDGTVNPAHNHTHVPVAPAVGGSGSDRIAPPMSAPSGRGGRADEPDRSAPEEARPERKGAVLLDNPAHQNHGMFATLLHAVNERDKEHGREPDEFSRQLAGGLVEKARERGLDTIGAARFTPDGTKVGMTDTADLSSPWAKTAVGDVGQLVGQKLSQSSENVAAINQQQALEQSLKPAQPTQAMEGPEAPTPKGPRLP